MNTDVWINKHSARQKLTRLLVEKISTLPKKMNQKTIEISDLDSWFQHCVELNELEIALVEAGAS